MTRPRLGVRSRLLVASIGAVALALGVALATFSFLLDQRLNASATSLARAEAEAEASSLAIRRGVLVAREGPDPSTPEGRAWVFGGGRVLEAPPASQELDRAARSLARGPQRHLDLGEHTRLYALPIERGDVRYGVVVSAVSLDPYEETSRTALLGALLLSLLVLAAMAVLSWWMLGRALRPVSQMTADAATWSEHDLDRRFDLGEPYDELTRLAATLDGLLERIAASLRHEQRFTAELSHELRTPLARISAEAELMLARTRNPDDYRSALGAVHRNALLMTRTVDALVSAARQEAGLSQATSDARDAVRAAVGNSNEVQQNIDVRISLPPEPVPVAIDEELVERMVQPLVENAVRYGRSQVDVSLERNESDAVIHVVDDGPGVAQDEHARIFDPSARGTAAVGHGGGAGLGLSLAQRLARSAGGEITVSPSRLGGRFALRLPLAR